MIANNVKIVLKRYSSRCEIFLVETFGHTYLKWSRDSHNFYIYDELRRVHKNLFHPNLEEL